MTNDHYVSKNSINPGNWGRDRQEACASRAAMCRQRAGAFLEQSGGLWETLWMLVEGCHPDGILPEVLEHRACLASPKRSCKCPEDTKRSISLQLWLQKPRRHGVSVTRRDWKSPFPVLTQGPMLTTPVAGRDLAIPRCPKT